MKDIPVNGFRKALVELFKILDTQIEDRDKYLKEDNPKYLDEKTIAGNKLFMIEETSLYFFGILTSNVHMLWMRTVGTIMKNDYRCFKDIINNNFPCPSPTKEQQKSTGDIGCEKFILR